MLADMVINILQAKGFRTPTIRSITPLSGTPGLFYGNWIVLGLVAIDFFLAYKSIFNS